MPEDREKARARNAAYRATHREEERARQTVYRATQPRLIAAAPAPMTGA